MCLKQMIQIHETTARAGNAKVNSKSMKYIRPDLEEPAWDFAMFWHQCRYVQQCGDCRELCEEA